jgi:hypothetical protein
MANYSGLTKKQQATLSELEKLSRKLGLRVYSGKLIFAGLKLKGGQCLLRDDSWVVIDRYQPYEEQVEVFRKGLGKVSIEANVALSCSLEVQAIIKQVQNLLPLALAPAAGAQESKNSKVETSQVESSQAEPSQAEPSDDDTDNPSPQDPASDELEAGESSATVPTLAGRVKGKKARAKKTAFVPSEGLS